MSLSLESLRSYPCVPRKYGINFPRLLGDQTLWHYTGESGRRIGLEVSESVVRATDLKDTSIQMAAYAPSGGVIEFSLKTRQNVWRHPDFFAAKFEKTAIDHFEENGIAISFWLTHWQSESTNFRMYIHALGRGLKPEEAVWETWSGGQAKKLGFSKISNLSPSKSDVICLFER